VNVLQCKIFVRLREARKVLLTLTGTCFRYVRIIV